MKYMLGNLTWNSRQWKGESHDKSNFKWIGSSSRHIGSESWNFKPGKGTFQYGFIENNGNSFPSFEAGGIIFFISTNVSERKRYIVGVYGHAEECYKEFAKYTANIRAPRKEVVLLPFFLELSVSRHLPKGKNPGRYTTFIGKKQARKIFGNILWQLKQAGFAKSREYRVLARLSRQYTGSQGLVPVKIAGAKTIVSAGPKAYSFRRNWVYSLA